MARKARIRRGTTIATLFAFSVIVAVPGPGLVFHHHTGDDHPHVHIGAFEIDLPYARHHDDDHEHDTITTIIYTTTIITCCSRWPMITVRTLDYRRSSPATMRLRAITGTRRARFIAGCHTHRCDTHRAFSPSL